MKSAFGIRKCGFDYTFNFFHEDWLNSEDEIFTHFLNDINKTLFRIGNSFPLKNSVDVFFELFRKIHIYSEEKLGFSEYATEYSIISRKKSFDAILTHGHLLENNIILDLEVQFEFSIIIDIDEKSIYFYRKNEIVNKVDM